MASPKGGQPGRGDAVSNDIPNRPPNSRRAIWWALIAGIVGLIVCAIGGWFAPFAFFPEYLAAQQFFLGIGLGCMVLLMIYHLTGGAWGFVSRRILEAGSRTVPVMAILFLPLFVGLGVLFPWARPELREISHLLKHQEPYSNIPFFCVRSVLYYVIWIGFIILLNLWSRRQDETGDPAVTRRLATLSALGLLIYGISVNFAAVDWQMSLQPAYHSTIVGPLLAPGKCCRATRWP